MYLLSKCENPCDLVMTPYGLYFSCGTLKWTHQGFAREISDGLDHKHLTEEERNQVKENAPTEKLAIATTKLVYFLESMREKGLNDGMSREEYEGLRVGITFLCG